MRNTVIQVMGPVSIYPKDVFEMVADRNAASSLAESSQRRLLLIETHPDVTPKVFSNPSKISCNVNSVQCMSVFTLYYVSHRKTKSQNVFLHLP